MSVQFKCDRCGTVMIGRPVHQLKFGKDKEWTDLCEGCKKRFDLWLKQENV